jgi:hypothetical protein
MLAAAILQSGARSVNINSTTGGVHDPRSNHYKGRAVDINRVDGRKVSPAFPAKAIQDAALLQPNIAENFGPSSNVTDKGRGRQPARGARLIQMHKTHIHLGGDK